MTATLTETILAVDGLRSPILQAGPPDATEAVVFVHGNPGSRRDWARLVERTGAFARAVAFQCHHQKLLPAAAAPRQPARAAPGPSSTACTPTWTAAPSGPS